MRRHRIVALLLNAVVEKVIAPHKGWPKSAVLSATITLYDTASGKTHPSMMALKFADSACDPTLQTCKNVLN